MNEKSTDPDGSSTAQANLSGPSQQATVKDVDKAEEHETENEKEEDESSEAEMGELHLIHKKICMFTDINT